MKNVWLGLLLGVFALVAAACGGGAEQTSTTATSTTVAADPGTSSTTTIASTTVPSSTTTTAPRPAATSTIVVIQQDLAVLGYFTGAVDGIAGEETRAAIAKFQADAGIEADGEFGSKTDAALVPKLQSNVDYVTDVQETLVELKYYGGPVDGDYGNGTQRGVKLLQRSCEIEETGKLDIKTRLCLGGHLQ